MSVTIEEGLKLGYLKNNKVFLKPIPRNGGIVNDINHMAYHSMDGAVREWCLPLKNIQTGELVNPFSSFEEKVFFEELTGYKLGVINTGIDNFWVTFKVSITVQKPQFFSQCLELDLKDPMDMLRYKMLKIQDDICDSWDKKDLHPKYRYALVMDNYKDLTAITENDLNSKVWEFFGSVKRSPEQMTDFLDLYYFMKKQNKSTPIAATLEYFNKEFKNIIEVDKNTMSKTIDRFEAVDNVVEMLIVRGIIYGSLTRTGINSYKIPGIDAEYTYTELIQALKDLKDIGDPVYLKLDSVVELNRSKLTGEISDNSEVTVKAPKGKKVKAEENSNIE